MPLGGVSRPTGAAGALRKPAPGAAGDPWTRLGASGAHLRTLRALRALRARTVPAGRAEAGGPVRRRGIAGLLAERGT